MLIESYSILPRLPPPHRMQQHLVVELLRARFQKALLTLCGKAQMPLLRQAVEGRVGGGAIYDALVALTARKAGATLLTRDRRALSTYEIVGARYQIVG